LGSLGGQFGPGKSGKPKEEEKVKRLLAILAICGLVFSTSFAMVGCDTETTEEEIVEERGDEIEEMTDDAPDEIEDAGDEYEEETDEL
jgi:hypothetical protein